jgi:hypothetical protein
MSHKFKSGDRVVYVGRDTRHNQPSKKGWRGVVVDRTDMECPSDMVLVQFDNHLYVHTLYLANVELDEPLDGTMKDGSIYSAHTHRWFQIVPRKMVRGDLVSGSMCPTVYEPPTTGWKSMFAEYFKGGGINDYFHEPDWSVQDKIDTYRFLKVNTPPRYRLQQEVDQLKNEIYNLRTDNARLQTLVNLGNEAVDAERKQNDALEDSNLVLQSDIENLRTELLHEKSLRETYERIATRRRGEIKALESRISNMQRAAQEVRKHLDSIYEPTDSQANTGAVDG